MLLHISSITKSKFSQRKKNWENNSVRASIFSCPSPLCCSVNGQWDNSACGALFTEDRYALTHQQLQELLKMSAYAHMHIQSRSWKPSGEKGLSPAAITCIHTCYKSGVGDQHRLTHFDWFASNSTPLGVEKVWSCTWQKSFDKGSNVQQPAIV